MIRHTSARRLATAARVLALTAAAGLLLSGCAGSPGGPIKGAFDTSASGSLLHVEVSLDVQEKPSFTPEPENPEMGTFVAAAKGTVTVTNKSDGPVGFLPTSALVRARLIAPADSVACDLPVEKGSRLVSPEGEDYCLSPYAMATSLPEMDLAPGESITLDLSGMNSVGELTVVVVPDNDDAREAYARAYFTDLAGVCVTTTSDAGPDDYEACIMKDGSVIV